MAADNLRQRLVGGAALLVIGMIAWFWLLSADSPVDPVDRTTQIPPAPEIKPFAVPEPAAPQDIPALDSGRVAADSATAPMPAPSASVPKPAVAPPKPVAAAPSPAQQPAPKAAKPAVAAAKPAATDSAKPEPKKAEPKPTENFQLDAQGLPVAWVVQVGLFATQANADKVKATLQEKGFKAYTEVFRPAGGTAGVKVFVGPKLSRERADAQKKAIDQALKVNAKVVRFQA